jgi:hypothetical protein
VDNHHSYSVSRPWAVVKPLSPLNEHIHVETKDPAIQPSANLQPVIVIVNDCAESQVIRPAEVEECSVEHPETAYHIRVQLSSQLTMPFPVRPV